MINKPVNISIPVIWGDETFQKEEWGAINYIVGSNGTGKSILAEQLKANFSNGGFTARYLNAERLIGFEKKATSRYGGGGLERGFDISALADYKNRAEQSGLSSSAIIILKERLDIRIKIEALLSDMFNKTIRLVEEGGFLKPKIQNISSGEEYNMANSECHGLKELITLLTFIYSPDKNCLILDEPELHLHPQYQSFFLEEIRKLAGNPREDPTKKMFFIITHSPYFLDLKKIDELKDIIVCQLDKTPVFVRELEGDDEYILKKFIPRFNTHHKQFFFSPNPVFVEGYTDQQMLSTLLEKIGINLGASGSCIIDVGGKDELGVFYRLCKSLQINCRIIADLDAMFKGRLRRVVCEDPKSSAYIQSEGIGVSLSNEIGDLETQLNIVADFIIGVEIEDEEINHLKDILSSFDGDTIHRKRISMLLASNKIPAKIESILDDENIARINLVKGRVVQLYKAFESCNVFIIPKGEIEHYYTQTEIDYLSIKGKDTSFHTERDYLLSVDSSEDITTEYSELIGLVKKAVPIIEVEIKKHLKFVLIEWLQIVQRGVARNEISSLEDLKRNAKVNYKQYEQILDVSNLTIEANKSFSCTFAVKEILDPDATSITFTHETIAHSFNF
jgi:hypothetical protein